MIMELEQDHLEESLLSGGGKIYLLYGKSGVGKSAFLKTVLHGRNVLWLTSEQMKRLIIDNVLGMREIPTSGYDYIVIDNIEDIIGEATTAHFSKVLDLWVDAGMTVAMTECRPRWNKLNTRSHIWKVSMDKTCRYILPV